MMMHLILQQCRVALEFMSIYCTPSHLLLIVHDDPGRYDRCFTQVNETILRTRRSTANIKKEQH